MFNAARAAILLLSVACSCADAAESVPVNAKRLAELGQSAGARAAAAVEPANESVLAAEVTAVVKAVSVDVAQSVAAGDSLVMLDATDIELQVEQAQANLAAQDSRIAQASERLRRARDLAARNYASADELLARETDVAVLEADRKVLTVALAIARRELAKTVITAPFDGVVTNRAAQVGALATPATPLITLVQSAGQSVVAQLPPDQAATLEAATGLFFEADGNRWPLRLDSLSPVIDARRRVQPARLKFTADAAPPGLSGYLAWRISQPTVGPDYVVRREGRLGIFLVNNGQARFHVLPGAEEGRAAGVSLPGDTLIITSGQNRLQDGDPVTVSQ